MVRQPGKTVDWSVKTYVLGLLTLDIPFAGELGKSSHGGGGKLVCEYQGMSYEHDWSFF